MGGISLLGGEVNSTKKFLRPKFNVAFCDENHVIFKYLYDHKTLFLPNSIFWELVEFDCLSLLQFDTP